MAFKNYSAQQSVNVHVGTELAVVTSDKGGSKCICLHSFVCLSVCLLARLLKNTCMDLDEMLHVGTWTNWLTDPDYSPDAGTGLPSDIICAATQNFIKSGKIPRTGIWRLSLQRCMVLKWFYSLRAVGTPLSEVHALHREPF